MGAAAEIEVLVTTPTGTAGAKTVGGPRPFSPRRGEPCSVAGALELPARYLFELPLAPSLGLHVPGVPGVIRVSAVTDASEETEVGSPDDTEELRLSPEEWVCLVEAAEADRIWPTDLTRLLRRRAEDPELRLSREITMEGAQPDPAETWSLSRVLRRIGAELLSIDL